MLKKDFDLNGIIATLELNPLVKHVRLASTLSNRSCAGDLLLSWDGPVDEVVEGVSLVALTRCFGWSDQDHVASVDYYKGFVLPHCRKGFMESSLQPLFKQALEIKGM
jgi:hypothetical protein